MRKAKGFTVLLDAPLNGGPALAGLADEQVTPLERWFVRSHGPAPKLRAASYRLSVGGLVKRPRLYTLAALKREFPHKELEASLVCAGNRRKELNALEQVSGEIPWGPEAIGNARWGGVPLRDVLRAAGVARGARHVCFTGLDAATKGAEPTPFGGSIPIRKALQGGVLLAFEMNGKPLAPEHGAPLRAVVPGYIGARSVKWLGSIALTARPSANPFQRKTYKVVPRGATAREWEQAPALGPVALNCAICTPLDGESVPHGSVTVRGYALGSHGHRISRVEVSPDGGTTWKPARLRAAPSRWAWRLWQAELRLPPGRATLVARAFDDAGKRQPASLASAWNAGGYVNNAQHRIRVAVEARNHP